MPMKVNVTNDEIDTVMRRMLDGQIYNVRDKYK